MSRIGEFDPEKALDKAMHLFWMKGYRNISASNIVEVTGVGKKGLHTVFGNNHELYVKAIWLV